MFGKLKRTIEEILKNNETEKVEKEIEEKDEIELEDKRRKSLTPIQKINEDIEMYQRLYEKTRHKGEKAYYKSVLKTLRQQKKIEKGKKKMLRATRQMKREYKKEKFV